MALDRENIVNVLLSPETFLSNTECVDYIAKVNQFSLERLAAEPEKLKEEKKQLLQQKQELAFSNYKTFIRRAECLNQIHKKFKKVQGNLNLVTNELLEFSKKCQDLRKITSEVDEHKRLNSLVLANSSDLLKVLELPQLMENCIKNGQFDEALELSSYIKWLGKKYGNIQLVKSIVNDSEVLWQVMLNQLLMRLRTDLQLPKCLEIIGLIRRMEAFSDAELRLKFLQGRDTWFQNLLGTIPQTDGNQYILKVIELTRIHMFNIVTQYRAIFSDEESLVPSMNTSKINESFIFYSWLNEKISQFMVILDNPDTLRNVSLDSVIGQSMYFAQSFSRVGADFRGLLAVKFIKIIEQNFELSLMKINKKFKQDMDNFAIKKIPLVGKIKVNVDVKPEQPPMCLIEFYPLVDYLNGILRAFNDIRSCVPLAAAESIKNSIQESLKFCSKVILQYYKVEQQTFEKAEKEKFMRFCGGFQIMVNYLQKCLLLLFPVSEVANHIGIPSHQLQKEGFTFISADVIEPISHLMPVDIPSLKTAETS